MCCHWFYNSFTRNTKGTEFTKFGISTANLEKAVNYILIKGSRNVKKWVNRRIFQLSYQGLEFNILMIDDLILFDILMTDEC